MACFRIMHTLYVLLGLYAILHNVFKVFTKFCFILESLKNSHKMIFKLGLHSGLDIGLGDPKGGDQPGKKFI